MSSPNAKWVGVWFRRQCAAVITSWGCTSVPVQNELPASPTSATVLGNWHGSASSPLVIRLGSSAALSGSAKAVVGTTKQARATRSDRIRPRRYHPRYSLRIQPSIVSSNPAAVSVARGSYSSRTSRVPGSPRRRVADRRRRSGREHLEPVPVEAKPVAPAHGGERPLACVAFAPEVAHSDRESPAVDLQRRLRVGVRRGRGRCFGHVGRRCGFRGRARVATGRGRAPECGDEQESVAHHASRQRTRARAVARPGQGSSSGRTLAHVGASGASAWSHASRISSRDCGSTSRSHRRRKSRAAAC